MNKYSFENLQLLVTNNDIAFMIITYQPVFTMEDA